LGKAVGVEGTGWIGRAMKAYTGVHQRRCGMGVGLEELGNKMIYEGGL
jgi:hypothetical protein